MDALRSGAVERFTVNSSLHARSVYERFGFVATAETQYKEGLAFVPMEIETQ